MSKKRALYIYIHSLRAHAVSLLPGLRRLRCVSTPCSESLKVVGHDLLRFLAITVIFWRYSMDWASKTARAWLFDASSGDCKKGIWPRRTHLKCVINMLAEYSHSAR